MNVVLSEKISEFFSITENIIGLIQWDRVQIFQFLFFRYLWFTPYKASENSLKMNLQIIALNRIHM